MRGPESPAILVAWGITNETFVSAFDGYGFGSSVLGRWFSSLGSILGHAASRSLGTAAGGGKLFARPPWGSSVVTAVVVPDGIDGKAIVRVMEEKHGVVIAGGQEHLAGKIFRIGHMGYVTKAHLDECLAALRLTLVELGYKLPVGA